MVYSPPRMYSCENGFFGCPATTSFQKQLVIAFQDFKTFQKNTGIRCSQRIFVPRFAAFLHLYAWACYCWSLLALESNKVWKPEKHGAHMAHKGFNGRVLVLWLADCMQRVVTRTTSEDRDLGKWLSAEILRTGQSWPNDDLQAPVACAMWPSLHVIFWWFC